MGNLADDREVFEVYSPAAQDSGEKDPSLVKQGPGYPFFIKKDCPKPYPASEQFIRHVDQFGECRYLEISVIAYGGQVVDLDRIVWELRKLCTSQGYGYIENKIENKKKDSALQRVKLQDITLREGFIPQKYRLPNGFLEKIIDDKKHPAREMLLWQNGFFGKKGRRSVRHRGGFRAVNSPLFNHPEILDEVGRYVHILPKVAEAYRKLMLELATK